MYSEIDDHDQDHDPGEHHLVCVEEHPGYQQDELGEIHLGHDGFIITHDLYTLDNTPVKEIPDGQAQENKQGKVGLPGIKDYAENKCVDEHEAERLQHPPDPVQIGVRYLRFQR